MNHDAQPIQPEMVQLHLTENTDLVFDACRLGTSTIAVNNELARRSIEAIRLNGNFWATMTLHKSVGTPARYFLMEETATFKPDRTPQVYKASVDRSVQIFPDAKILLLYLKDRRTAAEGYDKLIEDLLTQAASLDEDIRLERLCTDPFNFEKWMGSQKPL